MRKNKKLLFFGFLKIFGVTIFLFIITAFNPSPYSIVLAKDFYIFDARNYFFSRWCYSVQQCPLEQPPPGKNFNDLVYNFDALAFLVSLQGLVNREEKQLLLISSALTQNG
ncbi:MAG: hypothetical protein NC935_07115 [Candidatus Omnitrophica bacterium]|nr:hypothetical protein [Candidatus Omnitrophota bacterium]